MASAVVVGVGPGIGAAVARRFARGGLDVAVIARRADVVRSLADEVGGLPLVADATDDDALAAALAEARAAHGVPDVVVYNAAIIREDRLGDLASSALLDTWAVNVAGAYRTAALTLPAMAERGHGTFVVTGGMAVPDPGLVSLSLGKAGVRALVDLLDREYADRGVHVATVTVTDVVEPGSDLDPDDLAAHYWRLHAQPRDRWEREVVV